MNTRKGAPEGAGTSSPQPQPDADFREAMKAAAGSADHNFNMQLLMRTLATAWSLDGARKDEPAMIPLAIATRIAMTGFEPRNEIEGLLVGTAVGLHHGAMECLRRAVLPDQTVDGAIRSWKQSASLARAMVETIAALDRRRQPITPSAPV